MYLINRIIISLFIILSLTGDYFCQVIARVGDREITYKDFIERAEYTIRPSYCKGNFINDKIIVLNSLIAEKMLSLEAGTKNELSRNSKFISFITGRKEQKMREVLYYHEARQLVKLDTSEINKLYFLAERTYKIQYVNVTDKVLIDSLKSNDTLSQEIFRSLNQTEVIPEREIAWNSPETEFIHNILFSEQIKNNQIIGPFTINDTTHLLIKVTGWNDRVAINESDIKKRWEDVVEKLTNSKADSIYDNYVFNLMADKKIIFDVDIFNKVAHAFAPFYMNRKKDAENEFLKLSYENDMELKNPANLSGSLADIKDKVFFAIESKNGKQIWTVGDLLNEIEKHPLIFRKNNQKELFVEQLRISFVDLIRDKFITDAAYQKKYDKDEIVVKYEQTWYDASMAPFQRDEYLRKLKVENENTDVIFNKYLNPYIKELLKKYSDEIFINVDEYDKIKLTRIDMFTTEANVPYKVYVPAFPQLTTYNRLDYGKKMNAN